MSIVCRGLGRKAAAAALIVSAGLGLSLLVDERPPEYRGHGHADSLSLQVARGERGSGGWWGYVAPPAPAQTEQAAQAPVSAAPALDLPVARDVAVLTREQAKQLDQLLPSARNAEEVALLLAMVLSMPPPAATVTVTTGAPPARPTDDELALLALLLAAETTRH